MTTIFFDRVILLRLGKNKAAKEEFGMLMLIKQFSQNQLNRKTILNI